MRKAWTKQIPQADGSTKAQTCILAPSLNLKTLDRKFGIREEGFLDTENRRELVCEEPRIFLCNSVEIRSLVKAQSWERVFVVEQVQREYPI